MLIYEWLTFSVYNISNFFSTFFFYQQTALRVAENDFFPFKYHYGHRSVLDLCNQRNH